MIFKLLISKFRILSANDKRLARAVAQITGAKPFNISVYRLSLTHSSSAELSHAGFRDSNERLEYLGDAVLGTIVAEFLFKKFPYKDEGFLTEIRARIVNRESLNDLARKIGLDELVIYEGKESKKPPVNRSVYGNAFEAFIGAVFLDKGFDFTRSFVIRKIIAPHFDMDIVVESDRNYKSKLIEWSQKNAKKIRFSVTGGSDTETGEFKAEVFLDNEQIAVGLGRAKKKAEQDAARKACEKLAL